MHPRLPVAMPRLPGVERLRQPARDVGRVGGVYQHTEFLPVLLHTLAGTTVPGDNGRQAATHRLQRSQAERLIEGG